MTRIQDGEDGTNPCNRVSTFLGPPSADSNGKGGNERISLRRTWRGSAATKMSEVPAAAGELRPASKTGNRSQKSAVRDQPVQNSNGESARTLNRM
jgi:hypothetical protein